MTFELDVKNALKKVGVINIKLEIPPDKKLGDLAFVCFDLAKEQKRNPADIAKELAEKIIPEGTIARIEASGPYVNFFVDNKKIVEEIIVEASKESYGRSKPKGKALVEHTSINPNASPHVGRARNAIIGDSIVRILRFYGYDVETHYYINDVGKQIALLVYAINKNKIKNFSFEQMLDIYIKANAEMITNASVEKEVFELLRKLENGNQKVRKMFQKVVSIAVRGQVKIFKELGINYDKFDYESQYLNSIKLKKILKALKKWIFKDNKGRVVLSLKDFNLPLKKPVFVLTRSNETSLYGLRDIAYNLDKLKIAKKNIVVLGEEQKLYFQQISAALKLLKKEAPELVTYSYVLLPSGKMSTRKGNVVMLTEFMKEAIEKAKYEILKRNPKISIEDLDKISKDIAYGAIKYSFLKVGANKNIIFRWEEALNFEGDSAPYIQYTYVRSKKILEKIKEKAPQKIILEEEPEINLVKKIGEFPKVVEDATKTYNINSIAKYAFDLATLFNDFYERCNVLHEEDEEKRKSKVLLVRIYSEIIKKSLHLLGINCPEFM